MNGEHNLIGKKVELIWAIITVFMIVSLALTYYVRILPGSDVYHAFKTGYYLMGTMVLALLMFSIALEYPEEDTSHKLFFGMLIAAELELLSYLASEIITDRYSQCISLDIILLTTPMICLLFWFYQRVEALGTGYTKTYLDYLVLIGCITDCVFIQLGVLTGKMFFFDEQDHYIKGPWNIRTYVFPLAVLIVCLVMTLRYRFSMRKQVAFMFFLGTPIIMALITLVTGNTIFTHSANIVGISIIYVEIQIYKKYEIEQQKKEIQKIRINTALSQINPHFIQNCLANIRGLMYVDEKQAEKLLSDLSGYLKATFTYLNEKGTISVREEMELVDFYLSIEQARFPGHILVEKEIELPDFQIPSFIIETLVENAVRHGLRPKEGEGTVRIEVLDKDRIVEINVIDDGIGFTKYEIEKDGAVHVGLKNVRKRIELMTKGNFYIESQKELGTIARIWLPKKSDNL